MNRVDKYRNDFFDMLIKEENDKEKAKKLKHANCFHNYNIMGLVNTNGYQERTCCKCGNYTIKSIRVWEGTKNGNCIIA